MSTVAFEKRWTIYNPGGSSGLSLAYQEVVLLYEYIWKCGIRLTPRLIAIDNQLIYVIEAAQAIESAAALMSLFPSLHDLCAILENGETWIRG